jgi:Gly-Xaa carboxypeptidase
MQLQKENYASIPKGETYIIVQPRRIQQSRWKIWQWLAPGLTVLAILTLSITQWKEAQFVPKPPSTSKLACPQFPALKPSSSEREKFETDVKNEINSENFFNRSLRNMQGAIRIPTESFDDMGDVGVDPRWDIFVDFHKYLELTFPLV